MTFFPLIHVLFWIALTTGPHDMSQITIKGPYEFGAWTWTKEEDGWVQSGGQSILTIDGNTVIENLGEKTDKQDLSQFVKGIKEHDWDASASLNLGTKPMCSLTKSGDAFVYTFRAGDRAEERFVIEFKKK